jgi:integrase
LKALAFFFVRAIQVLGASGTNPDFIGLTSILRIFCFCLLVRRKKPQESRRRVITAEAKTKDMDMSNEAQEDSAPKASAPHRRPFKFTDPWMRNVKLPAGKRELYKSEVLERGCSLHAVIGKHKKAWYGSVYQDGKTVQTLLGNWPELNAVQARDKARELFKNPQRREREKAAGSVAEVVKAYVLANVRDEDGKDLIITAREVIRRFDRYVLPSWAHKRFAAIVRSDTALLLAKIKGEAQRAAVWQTLNALYTWQSQFMHDDWKAPISDTSKPKGARKRQRVLSKDELPIVWQAAGECGEFGRFTKFLFYCAQRRTKVLQMRWSDLKGNEWHIPRADGEKGVPPILRLPPAAMKLIEAQKTCTAYRGDPGDRIWHCRALSKGKKRLDAKVAALDTEGVMKGRWILHDCRRSSRTMMRQIKAKVRYASGQVLKNEDGSDRERRLISTLIAEAVLGHAIRVTSTQDTYEVDLDYTDEIGDALVILANHIAQIVGEKVPLVGLSQVA